MRRRVQVFLISIASGLFACESKQAADKMPSAPAPSPLRAAAEAPAKKAAAQVHQLTFIMYLDDGDYSQLVAADGRKRVSFINEIDTSRVLNRGDRIRVSWKYGKITLPGDNDAEVTAKLLQAVHKTADGPVSRFRKKYGKKLRYTWSADEGFSSSYLDKIYLLTEYYVANTANPLLKMAIAKRQDLTYSVESVARAGRPYRMIGIAPVGPNGSNVVEWIYIDDETDAIYAYQVPDDKLVPVR